ncbi:xylan glycosyltransferase MUCI21-like [Prosopis cineraria]|uniref:xylan glycosyltransferase MUCI21-like n=1 Tax=Prosopis cineraria TaxID=364024 RepID=UPI00240EE3FB|nr:xylan glycosyltransferase MUCI21-like [Prosopis cineraria]
MVQYHRYLSLKKDEDFPQHVFFQSQSLNLDFSTSAYCKRTRPNPLPFLFLALLCFCFVLATLFFGSSFTFSLLYSPVTQLDSSIMGFDANASSCSSVSNGGTICCDRSGYRSDICIMKGDIRTRSSSSSVFLFHSGRKTFEGDKGDVREFQHEKIRPYTRKWETSIMNLINELHLISKAADSGTDHRCDVQHDVPAVFFSNGGYTGNVYHEFNDGIIPLYITSQHLQKKVVFVILEYHNWWMLKYKDILSQLSDFPAIDFNKDNRTHCFPEAIVGLRIHDELTVNPAFMEGNKSVVDFRNLLDRAYWPRIKSLIQDEEREAEAPMRERVQENQWNKPRLVVISRSGSRAITNEDLMVKMAEETGFEVKVVNPDKTTELAKIYKAMNESDVMVGVHGAAMTHFLFLRPGSVFIQVVPLGTTWASETYYGEPARKLGLKYVGYEIHPKESSLYHRYHENDPVLRDPRGITKRGWEFTKKIYLDHQNVTLDLTRFQKTLQRAYDYTVSRLNLQIQQ